MVLHPILVLYFAEWQIDWLFLSLISPCTPGLLQPKVCNILLLYVRSFTLIHSHWLVFVLQSSSATATFTSTRSSAHTHTHIPTYYYKWHRTKKKWKRVVKLQHEVWFRCMAFLKYMAGRFSFILQQKSRRFLLLAIVAVLFTKSTATNRCWVAEESEICSFFFVR